MTWVVFQVLLKCAQLLAAELARSQVVGAWRPLGRHALVSARGLFGFAAACDLKSFRYENRRSKANPGLEQPLKFERGVHGEVLVDGWQAKPTER